MSHQNPYMKKPMTVDTEDDDNVSMKDNSLSLKDLGSKEEKQHEDSKQNEDNWSQDKAQNDEEEIDFEETQFQIPPSFSQPINEEMLHDNDHPYIFWASSRLPIPKDPANPMAAIYNALDEFITQMAEENPQFVVFPHNLPPPIKMVDDLPDNINKWLTFSPRQSWEFLAATLIWHCLLAWMSHSQNSSKTWTPRCATNVLGSGKPIFSLNSPHP